MTDLVVDPRDEAWFQAMPADDRQDIFWRFHTVNWRKHVLPRIEKKHGSLRWLEIGSFEGWSGLWVFDHVLKPGDTLTCVDKWDHAHEQQFDKKLLGRVEKRKMCSVDFLAEAIVAKRTYDVVYIDGDHEARAVLEDFAMTWHILPVGGIVIFDDYPITFPAPSTAMGPMPAIDAILHIYASRINVIFKEWQVIIEKTQK